MNNLFKTFLFAIATLTTGAITTSCSNTEEFKMDTSQDAQANTRAVGTKTPKLTVYMETNSVNPLNAGEYYFTGTNPREEVADHVILFASNIRLVNDTAQLHHNLNQDSILNRANNLIVPLQQKGTKVLLGLLGDHTGLGFANLTPSMVTSFAQQIANCVNTYGLDGVDFDDEYARYDLAPSYLPTPSGAIFGDLIQALRQLLPNKLITAFYFGYAWNLNSTDMNVLDYMWPNFGCNVTRPAAFPASKWAKLSVNFSPLNPPYPSQIQNCANNYTGNGAIMTFNLIPSSTTTTTMNYFASRIWGGRTVSWTQTIHPKNYSLY